jgi:hypothetical protein
MGHGSLRVGAAHGAIRRRPSAVAGATSPSARGAVRPMRWGERSGGGRVEDRGLVPCGPCGRFIGHEAGRGGDGPAQDGAQSHPLIGAARTRGGRGEGPGNAARASGARTPPGTLGTGLGRIVPSRVVCAYRGGAARDQVVEAVEVQQPVGLRGDQMVAAGTGRSRRGKAVDQEQHKCPGPPPRQSLERNGPHCTLAAMVTRWETSCSK